MNAGAGVMNRVAFGILLLFAFVLPWEDSVVLPGIGSVGRLFSMLLLAAAALALVVPGGLRLRRPSLFLLLMLGFVLWSGASLLWSVDPGATLVQLAIRFQLFLLAFFIWQLVDGSARRLAVMQAFVLGCSAAALNAAFNYLAGNEAVYQRYSASGVDPNEFATILALGIPMAWLILISGRHKKLFWPTLLYLPLALLGVLLTSSRGGALVTLVALGVIPLTLPALPARRRAAFGFVVTLGLTAMVLAGPQLADLVSSSLTRLSSTSRELSSGTLNERSEIWSAGFALFGEHSLLGVGAGAFPEAVAPLAGTPKVAHNSFVSVLVELGPPGLLLFLAVLLSVGLPLARLPRAELVCYLLLFCTLLLGLLPLTWEGRKVTWFVLTLLSTAATLIIGERPGRQRQVGRHA
jgi:O-antigen ligase